MDYKDKNGVNNPSDNLDNKDTQINGLNDSNDNVVSFKIGLNSKKDTCINFILELQNNLETSDIDISEYITSKKVSTSTNKNTNVTKIQFVEKVKVSNKDELLEFYRQKADENRKLPTKKMIAELTSISESTVERYNIVLKNEGLIETRGNSIYLCEGV